MGTPLMEGGEGAGNDFNPTDILRRGDGVALYKLGDDAELICTFYKKRVAVPSKSTEAALHFDEKVYCRIERPGDKLQVWDQPVRECDKQRFPHEWQRFLSGESQLVGTSIKVLGDQGLLTGAQLEMLEVANIRSVEQLANATPATVTGFGPDGQEIQKYARGFLNYQAEIQGKADIDNLRKEQDAKIDALTKELSELREKQAKPKEE